MTADPLGGGWRATSLPSARLYCAAALTVAFLIGLACERGDRAPSLPPSSVTESGAEKAGSFAHRLEEAEELLLQGRHEEAAGLFSRLRDELGASDENNARFRAALGWARCQRNRGLLEEAGSVLAELGELALGDPGRSSQVAELESSLLHRQGRLQEAESQARRALEQAQVAGSQELEAAAYKALGTVYSLGGRYQESLEIHEQLVALRRESSPPSTSLALALNELGIDYRHFARYEEAKEVYGEALEIYRAEGNRDGQAMVLFNLATVHAVTGDTERGLELNLESLRLAEEVGNAYGLGLLHRVLGETYRSAGNLTEARSHSERALAINRQAGQAYAETSSLALLGRVELALGNPERAQELLEEALELADQSGYGRESTTVRITQALRAAETGDADEALRWADEALARSAKLDELEVVFNALEARAVALEAASRWGEASETYVAAIELLETWRGRHALGDLGMGVTDLRWSVYEGAVRSLFHEERIAEGLAINERARSRFLLELMARREAPPASSSEREELLSRVRERFAALDRAPANLRDGIEEEIETLRGRLLAIERRTRERDPSVAAARFPAPVSADEIAERLVSPGRAVLSYLWGEREVYGWWLDRHGARGALLGNVEELEPLVLFLRTAIEDRSSSADWQPVAAHAHSQLVAPLEPTTVEEIVVIADGPLTLLPFEVLAPREGEPPWGASRRLLYGPSASVLVALGEKVGSWQDDREMLAVGYSPSWRERLFRARGEESTAPLPHAVAEARYVYRLFQPGGATLLTGRRATPERWLSARPEGFRRLHFATHARVDDRRPERTHLLLANGRLDLATLRDLDLSAELVTLSACETALGPRLRGEGVVGLSHAFLAAGAQGVVVSLWRIDDREAASFMRDFYRQLEDGSSPAEALLLARRARIEGGGEASHPAVWAPFILVGGLETQG